MRAQLPAAGAALLVVDIQPDFLPGGALGIAGGDRILAPLRRLLAIDRYPVRIATQDWHPPNHISFASAHPGRAPLDTIELYGHPQTLWPDHCVQGSTGATLNDTVPWESCAAIIRKGNDPAVDSYSAFRNNWDRDGRRPPTGLAGYLHERGVREVVIAGLARDFCVRWSALDAAAAGFNTYVVWDLTRPVASASDGAVRQALQGAGVTLLEAAALGV